MHLMILMNQQLNKLNKIKINKIYLMILINQIKKNKMMIYLLILMRNHQKNKIKYNKNKIKHNKNKICILKNNKILMMIFYFE